MVENDNIIIINNKETTKQEIIENAKVFFRERIAKKHMSNTEKLTSLDKFNVNPFLNKYLANFLTGNSDSYSIAKALVYPRILGTSINTTFGNQMQNFINDVLGSQGSLSPGIDIEFIDKIDGHRKFCQIKAGPNTINKDDIETIERHFERLINLARTNNRRVVPTDFVVGTLYGSYQTLNSFYLIIDKKYPVLAGNDFWTHLTGDKYFFDELTDAIGDIANEFDGTEIIAEIIDSLSKEIESNIVF
ncbi:PmeII family type II restriction endonuclease [Facklamia sp. P12934]|uniref:PmeII family type II restriction endonuclease n=1 Tax=Facklamia sp. P12934 TaxID=3421948 RepID=UPI003D168035